MTEKNYTKPELRNRIKSQVMASGDGGKPGQWSARKAQLVAQKYEAAGGGYKGPRTGAQKSLAKWTDQKWTTSDGKPAEKPDGTMRRYLPEKAWDKLTPGQKAATNKKKVEASRKGQQFVANTDAAQEARKEAEALRQTDQAPASLAEEVKLALLAKHKNPEGGLTEAGRRHFERSGESKDLKPGVKKPVDEMSTKDMKRKGSWARRFYGQSPLPPLKKPNGEPTRLALTAKAWGEPVPQNEQQARAIAAKGTRLLEMAKRQEGEKAAADVSGFKILGGTARGGAVGAALGALLKHAGHGVGPGAVGTAGAILGGIHGGLRGRERSLRDAMTQQRMHQRAEARKKPREETKEAMTPYESIKWAAFYDELVKQSNLGNMVGSLGGGDPRRR